jgi:hypothetical protein
MNAATAWSSAATSSPEAGDLVHWTKVAARPAGTEAAPPGDLPAKNSSAVTLSKLFGLIAARDIARPV